MGDLRSKKVTVRRCWEVSEVEVILYVVAVLLHAITVAVELYRLKVTAGR
jgi:hypothetical protein